MDVIFLGNHTVGVKVLNILNKNKKLNLKGVIAHPKDLEDGIKYESVYRYAIENNIKVIRSDLKSKKDLEFISFLKPDLIFVTDFKYILKQNILDLPRIGSINLHPSILPKYRGRASINWAIINGESELGLTAHWIDQGIDTGKIIKQIKFKLEFSDDINSVLIKYYSLYEQITTNIIDILSTEIPIGLEQNENQATYYPRRKPSEGIINWNQYSLDIYNFIRAISYPYPGAFSFINNQKLIIWKSKPEYQLKLKSNNIPGQIIKLTNNRIYVACKNSILEIIHYSPNKINLKSGNIFKSKIKD
tara:strand:+ start:2974 stop:3885 length:912 start_codon:yes stop_codon:yes gene_type:complete